MTSADVRRAPFAAHVALLVAGLLVALVVSERGTGFTTDEGSYAIQSEAIERGGWAIDWPFRASDPDAEHFPYHGGRVTEEAEYAYVSHPAWPAALSIARRIGPEDVGLRLLPLASVVVAALSAWSLARRLAGEVAARWAFWLVAASPALASGLMIWAHAPAIALGGAATLAAVQIADGSRGPWAWVGLGGAVAAGVLLRSEWALAAGALAATMLVIGVVSRRRPLVVGGRFVAGVTVATIVLERVWVREVTGGGGPDLSSRAGEDLGFVRGRVEGALTALVDGSLTSDGAALWSVVALGLVAAAALAARRGPSGTALGPELLLLAAAVATGVRLLVATDEPVIGLLVAWPVIALLALIRRDDDPRVLALLAGSGLFGLAVLATQYDDGGGLQWGGRYLSVAIVPLGVAVATVVVARLSSGARRALGALLVATATITLVIPDQLRRDNRAAMRAVGAAGADVVLTGGTQVARLDWAGWPERCWISNGDDLAEAVAVLDRSGVGAVALVALPPADLEDAGLDSEPTDPDWSVGLARVGGGGGGACPAPGANMRSSVVGPR